MQEVAAVEKYKALAEPAEMVAVEQVVVMVMAALLNKHTVVLITLAVAEEEAHQSRVCQMHCRVVLEDVELLLSVINLLPLKQLVEL